MKRVNFIPTAGSTFFAAGFTGLSLEAWANTPQPGPWSENSQAGLWTNATTVIRSGGLWYVVDVNKNMYRGNEPGVPMALFGVAPGIGGGQLVGEHNSLWVVSSGAFDNGLYTSTDGLLTFTSRSYPQPGAAPTTMQWPKWDGTQWIALIGENAGPPAHEYVVTSADAITWTVLGSLPIGDASTSFQTFAGLYVVACDNVGPNPFAIITSPDGSTWTSRIVLAQAGLYFAKSPSVIISVNGSQVARSTNGTAWTVQTLGTTYVNPVWAAGLSLFVMISGTGGVATSPDGLVWTETVGDLTFGPQLLGVQ